ncbi:hypothetical protein Tco_0128942 [Tanacetum coccineum]
MSSSSPQILVIETEVVTTVPELGFRSWWWSITKVEMRGLCDYGGGGGGAISAAIDDAAKRRCSMNNDDDDDDTENDDDDD